MSVLCFIVFKVSFLDSYAGSRSNSPADSQEDKDDQGGPEFSSLQGLSDMANADFDSRGNDRSRDEPPSKRTKMWEAEGSTMQTKGINGGAFREFGRMIYVIRIEGKY